MIIPVSFFRCSWRSTIQDACNDLRSDNFEAIFTSVGMTPQFSCVATSFYNRSLYMFWIKTFVALFALISWYLEDGICCLHYEEQWQLHNKFLSKVLLTYRYPDFESVHDYKSVLFFWVSIFSFYRLEIWKDKLLEKLNWLFRIRSVIFCITKWERAWKFKRW